MFEEEEDIVFENSPLEKYLKDVGYTDFEPEKPGTLGNEDSTNQTSSVSTNYFGISERLTDLRCKVGRLFLSVYDAESLKKDCVSTIINSGALNLDDLEFLQRFDPELFEMGDHGTSEQKSDCFGDSLMSFAANTTLKYSWAIFVGVFGVILGIASAFGCLYSLVFLSCMIMVPASLHLWISYQRSLHHRNMELLVSYSNKVRDLTSLMRKAVSLIQEMQFVFKGYTLVKAGVPMLFTETDTEGESKDIIYPELRESLYKCACKVITETQAAASHLVCDYPLSVELNNMFTYIGSVSLSELGITAESVEIKSKTLPLQTLKATTSLVACHQSEFLSRFLLCLSSKAHNVDEVSNCFDKLYSNFHEIFAVSLKEVDFALQSIQRSYQLHKSAVSEDEPKQISQDHHEKVRSKFDLISSAAHSLQLHLKVGCMRIQSIQALMERLGESEDIHSQNQQDEHELETLFDLVKINLDSAVSCWEEGVHRLQALKGNQQQSMTTVKEDSEGSEITEGPHVKESQAVDLHSKLVDSLEEEIDQIFEAFSEPVDEGQLEHATLSAEDLAKEKRQMEESRHLLLELKSVLYAHSKDPLISTSGFVQPPQKPTSSKQDNQHSEADFLLDSDKTEVDSDKTEALSKLEVQGFDIEHDRDLETQSSTEYNSEILDDFESNQKSTKPTDLNKPSQSRSGDVCQGPPGHVVKANPQHFNFQSSVAFSVAAAALARSRSMGRMEEYFGSDESD